MKRMILAGALALFTILVLPAPPAGAGDTAIKTDDDLVSAIQANTPEKHQEIAAWYTAKAADERKQAEEHRKMATAYVGSKAAYADEMHKHCDKLTALHEKLAAEYEKLAAEHETAAGAKQ